MPHLLLACTPIFGHVLPMLAIGRGLSERGYAVSVLTGSKYRRAVEAAGLRHLPLPAEVDYDYDDAAADDWLRQRHPTSRVGAARWKILGVFVRPLGPQYMALVRALGRDRYDAVIAETGFLGVIPLLLGAPRPARLPVFGVSVTPLSLRSVDCAPFGSGLAPGSSAFTRMRNGQIDYLLHRGPLRSLGIELDAQLSAVGAPPSPVSYFDLVTLFDRTFHLSVRGLEYPRREQPAHVVFAGLPPAGDMTDVPPPPWWGAPDGSRPVVHVTQGTIDNHDPHRLLAPTIRGLAKEPVWVFASTGGRPVERLRCALGGRVPDNAWIAQFLPYEALLARTAVMVTNGGFGGVQRALAHGVPLVVAGATEDKPEVAARVAWAGAGRNLRTGTPSPRQLRSAVRTVLHDPRYRHQAARLQREIGEHPGPVATIAAALETALAAPSSTRPA